MTMVVEDEVWSKRNTLKRKSVVFPKYHLRYWRIFIIENIVLSKRSEYEEKVIKIIRTYDGVMRNLVNPMQIVTDRWNKVKGTCSRGLI